jgi:tetratricopeptide (TPR) repeat protein
MSTLAGLLTIIANYRGGAITSLSYSPLTQRLVTAAYAYGQYLIKTLFPVGLAVFYPLPPGGVPIGQAEASALLLVLITALVVLRIRKRPYLIVGWLWFLVALVPVVGLFQVGSAQAYADRYTYFSQIGLFLGITFWVSESVEYRTRAKAVAISVGSLLLIAFSWLTFVQAGYWRNSYTLFMHDLEVAPKGNYLASAVLGGVFTDAGDHSVAKDYLMKSIEARPGYYESWICLGEIAAREGDYAKAEYLLQRAFRLGGYRSPEANYYMGWVLGRQGKPAEAVKCLANAVRLQPRYLAAEVELARQLMAAGKAPQAKQVLLDIIQRHPTDGQVRLMLDELARQSSSGK